MCSCSSARPDWPLQMLNILFLTDDREDYLADSLLHGLINLGDQNVVDYPRKDLLYASTFPEDSRESVYGNGFTLYGLLPERDVYRSLIWQRIENDFFDLIFVGNIWRQFGVLPQLCKSINRRKKPVNLAILDGDDDQRIYLCSKTRLMQYGLCSSGLSTLTKTKIYYFKRELNNKKPQSWREQLLPAKIREPLRADSPPERAGMIFKRCGFSIPETWIRVPDLNKKTKLLPEHIVDQEVASFFRTGKTSYAFKSQENYFDDLATSYYGITTKRSGWDCLRHYEIAASGCVPCFRLLNEKPKDSAPHGLNERNCIIYRDAANLKSQIDDLSIEQYQHLLKSAHHWAIQHTTTKEASRLLEDLGERATYCNYSR